MHRKGAFAYMHAFLPFLLWDYDERERERERNVLLFLFGSFPSIAQLEGIFFPPFIYWPSLVIKCIVEIDIRIVLFRAFVLFDDMLTWVRPVLIPCACGMMRLDVIIIMLYFSFLWY